MARHKEFDRDETLQKAMEVFWSRGYEAASIEDLVKHMGINRQSLYDTFGDKHRLYLLALDRYREVEGRRMLDIACHCDHASPAMWSDAPHLHATKETLPRILRHHDFPSPHGRFSTRWYHHVL